MNEQAPASLPPQRPRRRWLRAVALASVIFISGMIVGGGLTVRFLWNRLTTGIQQTETMPDRVIKMLDRRLGLSEEQRSEIFQLLKESQNQFLQIRKDALPRVDDELNDLQAKIDSVLSEEQSQKWNRIYTYYYDLWMTPLLDSIDEAESDSESIESQDS